MASDDALEQFVVLAKTAQGRAAAQIIEEATAHPQIFGFGELLSSQNIQSLLKIFCYGRWEHYKNSISSLPPLNDQQTIKLKQLTIMAMAESLKILSYESLMASLDISSLRELEDLLITGCIYTGVVKGKLNQEKRQFEVHFSKGRDVSFEQVGLISQRISRWLEAAEKIFLSIEENVASTKSEEERKKKRQEQLKEQIEKAREELKDMPDATEAMMMGEDLQADIIDFDKEERTRPKRRR